MVKIVNPLGDVKIGKQGEVVYQRHYGEQTRRMLSPKRAIASEAQVAHRQLYRAALDWRKALSRPNRRYLEGYCIANGVVDGYHIPLPWHRFALKCYLEHIHFIPDLELVEGESIPGEKKDYCEDTTGGFFYGGQTAWLAQTFTPLEPYPIGKVILWLSRINLPGIVTVGIRNTNGSGWPTGSDLTSGQINGNLLPEYPNYAWTDIEIDPYDLTQGVLYGAVSRAPDAGGINNLVNEKSVSNACYPRGEALKSNTSGNTWTPQNWDMAFQVWSADQAGEKHKAGILHVRHPALMSVVHKRGEATINKYENLSSLDEEYLTKQVGIDVEAGDTIEATTVAGIEKKYQVV